MTVPAAYDAVTMSIEPGAINFAADGIKDLVQGVVSALNTIGTTLSGLQLSWNGDAAGEAQDFANQWMNAMTGLFGSEGDPKSGVMNQVIIAMLTATGNYSACEESVSKMFMEFAGSMLTGSGGGSATAPIPAGTAQPNGNLSAIAEVGWTSIP